mmetsp:Transcript_20677/g.52754  ORF Transcript_20677/g.52754 Transcript_20677/m.52754 type:complete len:220 (-) Transcript_20677:269-928(-)
MCYFRTTRHRQPCRARRPTSFVRKTPRAQMKKRKHRRLQAKRRRMMFKMSRWYHSRLARSSASRLRSQASHRQVPRTVNSPGWTPTSHHWPSWRRLWASLCSKGRVWCIAARRPCSSSAAPCSQQASSGRWRGCMNLRWRNQRHLHWSPQAEMATLAGPLSRSTLARCLARRRWLPSLAGACRRCVWSSPMHCATNCGHAGVACVFGWTWRRRHCRRPS